MLRRKRALPNLSRSGWSIKVASRRDTWIDLPLQRIRNPSVNCRPCSFRDIVDDRIGRVEGVPHCIKTWFQESSTSHCHRKCRFVVVPSNLLAYRSHDFGVLYDGVHSEELLIPGEILRERSKKDRKMPTSRSPQTGSILDQTRHHEGISTRAHRFSFQTEISPSEYKDEIQKR